MADAGITVSDCTKSPRTLNRATLASLDFAAFSVKRFARKYPVAVTCNRETDVRCGARVRYNDTDAPKPHTRVAASCASAARIHAFGLANALAIVAFDEFELEFPPVISMALRASLICD